MAFYELVEGNSDSGMLVVGGSIDRTFHKEAEQAGHPDERLEKIQNVNELLNPNALTRVARAMVYGAELADSD